MTCLENLLVAQHNKLMRASGYTFAGLFGLPAYRARGAGSGRIRAALARARSA